MFPHGIRPSKVRSLAPNPPLPLMHASHPSPCLCPRSSIQVVDDSPVASYARAKHSMKVFTPAPETHEAPSEEEKADASSPRSDDSDRPRDLGTWHTDAAACRTEGKEEGSYSGEGLDSWVKVC